MDAALQHHKALLHRVDAERQEAVEVVRLDMARDQRDFGAAGVEHDTRPHVHLHAAPHRPLVAEATVRDRLDRPGHGERPALAGDRRHRDLAADRERHLGADPGRDRLLHGLGVVDREGGDVFEPLAQDRGEHGGRVHRAARGILLFR